jgi:hypothetical protein
VTDGVCQLGGVSVRLGLRLGEDSGGGITVLSIRGLRAPVDDIDGLPTTAPVDREREAPARSTHPNGATALDHVVVVTPDFDRTTQALEAVGIPFRRVRRVGDEHDAGSFRQGFRRLGPAILEVVEALGVEPGPARFWGLVVIVADLDALKERLADRLTNPKPAVQPGRRIATLERAAGLSPRVAFMTPEP